MRRALARRVTGGRPDDEGQIMVLALGFTVVLLLLISVVVSLTGIQLERKRLVTLADNLALEAADSIDAASVYGGTTAPGGDGPQLSDSGVMGAVMAYLDENPQAGLAGVRVEVADTPDGRSARVVLSVRARPTLISPVTELFSDGVVLTATSTARASETP